MASRAQANSWLAHILEGASEHAVIFLDTKGHVVAWLGAAEKLFGYSKSEALGLKFGDLFTPDDRRLQMDQQEIAVARAMGRSEDERWHVRKDGTVFWASGVVAAVKSSDGDIDAFCKVLRDRTDLRQQLDALQNRVRTLQLENQRNSQLLESVGHQLRSLVSHLREASEPVEGQSSALQNPRCGALVRQLTAISSVLEATAMVPAAGVLESAGETISLQEALQTSLEEMRRRASTIQHLHLTIPSVPLTISADPKDLQEMLRQLLSNALKDTQSGGNIYVTASAEAASAVIRVTDDGIGIPGKRLSRIFSLLAFADLGNLGRDSEADLAHVRDLAARLGGSLEARSRGKGIGSVFTLRLPLVHDGDKGWQ